MPYITRQVWHQTSAAGSGYYTTERVFTPAVGLATTMYNQRLARERRVRNANQRAAAQVRIAAKSAAERERAAKAAAEAKRAAKVALRGRVWSQIQENARRSRNAVAPPKIAKSAPVVTPGRAPVGSAAAAVKPDPNATPGSPAWLAAHSAPGSVERGAKVGRTITRSDNLKALVAQAKAHPADHKTAKRIEALAGDALNIQKASNGQELDPDYVDNVRDAIQNHAQQVAAKFSTFMDALTPYMVKGKDGKWHYKDLVSQTKGLAITGSKDYKRIMAEYNRLFGDQTKAHGTPAQVGAYRPAMANIDQIGINQRNYLANAARTTVYAHIRQLSSMGEREEAGQESKAWLQGGQYMFGYVPGLVVAGPHSIKGYRTSKKTGKKVPIYRTDQEEYEWRGAEYIRKLQEAYEAGQAQQNSDLANVRRLTLAGELNTREDRQQHNDALLLEPVWKKLGMKDGPHTGEEIQAVVDEGVHMYDLKYRASMLPLWMRQAIDKGENMAVDPKTGQRVWVKQTPQYNAYMGALDAAKQRFYKMWGGSDPGVLGTVTNIPGIKQALQLLNTGVGGLGTPLRVIAYATTGESQIQLGVKIEDLPQKMQAIAASAFAPAGFAAVGGMGNSGMFGGSELQIHENQKKWDTWARSGEGRAWAAAEQKKRLALTHPQDLELAGALGGSGSIWDKLVAIGNYGQTPFSDDAVNLAFQFAADPTNALPLKATTWLARVAAARRLTEGVTGAMGLKRIALGVHTWSTITEDELKILDYIGPYIKKIDKGLAPRVALEQLMESLGGVTDLTKRQSLAGKFLQNIGVNPREASSHQVMSLIEEALGRRFSKAGIDYKDVAAAAGEAEAKRTLDVAAKKEADAAALRADHARAEARRAELTSKWTKTNEAGAARVATSKEAERAAIEARAAKTVATEVPVAHTVETVVKEAPVSKVVTHVPTVHATAKAPLAHVEADPAHISMTPGHRDPVIAKMADEDPIHLAHLEADAAPVDAFSAERAAMLHHGADFAPTQFSKEFFASAQYKRAKADLVATMPDGTPNVRVQQLARDHLYEVARRSTAQEITKEEGIRAASLFEGVIPWEWKAHPDPRRAAAGEEVAWSYRGGKSSSKQYLATQMDARSRLGARPGKGEMEVDLLQREMERKQRALVQKSAELREGDHSPESIAAYNDWVNENVRGFGTLRRSTRIEEDVANQIGMPFGATSYQSAIGQGSDFIGLGRQMMVDMAATGDLRYYYEPLSMLPGEVKGVGYQTVLMENILDQSWRIGLDAHTFAELMGSPMFNYVDELAPGPREFRANMSHLFALFHMTLLDPDGMARLEEYSKVIQIGINAGAVNNVYARAWQVMETYMGLPWASKYGFAGVEKAFMEAVMNPKFTGNLVRMEPNLALGMISYGPMARKIGRARGYAPLLGELGSTFDPLFKASNPGWVDEDVVYQLSKIAEHEEPLEQAVGRASQIIHYIATRYGEVMRRKQFPSATLDYAIEASIKFRRAGPAGEAAVVELRNNFIRRAAIEEDVVRDAEGKLPRAFVERQTALFGKAIKGWRDSYMVRTSYASLHDAYEEMYWGGRISHDNAGLHTAQFLMKMQDASIQRGFSWHAVANAYWEHMVMAGEEEMATHVLQVVLAPQIKRVASNSFEMFNRLGESTDPILAALTDGVTVHSFMVKTGLLNSSMLERTLAEGKKRTHTSMSYVEKQAQDAIDTGEAVVEEGAARARAADPDAMYDYADLSHLGDRLVSVRDEMGTLSESFQRLPEIDPKTLSSAVWDAKTIRDKQGVAASVRFLRKLPFDVRRNVMVALRQEAAGQRAMSLLNQVGYRMLDVNSVSSEVGEQVAELVKFVQEVPGGDAMLGRWVDRFGKDLERSHAIDYLKHEDFFNWRASAERSVVDRAGEAVNRLDSEIKSLEETLRTGVVEVGSGTRKKKWKIRDSQRAGYEARLPQARNELVVARLDHAIAKERETIATLRRKVGAVRPEELVGVKPGEGKMSLAGGGRGTGAEALPTPAYPPLRRTVKDRFVAAERGRKPWMTPEARAEAEGRLEASMKKVEGLEARRREVKAREPLVERVGSLPPEVSPRVGGGGAAPESAVYRGTMAPAKRKSLIAERDALSKQLTALPKRTPVALGGEAAARVVPDVAKTRVEIEKRLREIQKQLKAAEAPPAAAAAPTDAEVSGAFDRLKAALDHGSDAEIKAAGDHFESVMGRLPEEEVQASVDLMKEGQASIAKQDALRAERGKLADELRDLPREEGTTAKRRELSLQVDAVEDELKAERKRLRDMTAPEVPKPVEAHPDLGALEQRRAELGEEMRHLPTGSAEVNKRHRVLLAEMDGVQRKIAELKGVAMDESGFSSSPVEAAKPKRLRGRARENAAKGVPMSDDFVEHPLNTPGDKYFDGPFGRPEFNNGGESVFYGMDYAPSFRGELSKIHVAATVNNGQEMLRIVDALAREMGVAYKWVRRKQLLVAGEDFGLGGAQQGKFITVYPPPEQAREFAQRLDERLTEAGITGGHVAPSERRWAPDSPIAHRYVPDSAASGDRYAVDGDYASHPDFIGMRDTPSPHVDALEREAAGPGPVAAPPDPASMAGPKVSLSQNALKLFGNMTEEEYLARETAKAERRMRLAVTPAEKSAARTRLRDLGRSARVIEYAKTGKSYIPHEARTSFSKRVLHSTRDRARAVIAPATVGPYVMSPLGSRVEQTRSLWVRLNNAPTDRVAYSRVLRPEGVSETYTRYGEEIEHAFSENLPADMLISAGFPARLADTMTYRMLALGTDDFANSMKNKLFQDLLEAMQTDMKKRLVEITGNKDYEIRDWLTDRLGKNEEFYDAIKFEEHDRIFERAIIDAREGEMRQTVGTLRRGERELTGEGDVLVEMLEEDVRAAVAKAAVADRLGIDLHRWNEARMVLSGAMVRSRRSSKLSVEATDIAKRALDDAGVAFASKEWKKRYPALYDEAFDKLRRASADYEADQYISQLAQGEMYLMSPEAIINEFEKRYTRDGDIDGFTPQPLTEYQRRTLEEAVKTHGGVDDLTDQGKIIEALNAHGQHPPFHSRTATREWLTKYGFWSPRTGEAIAAGKKSWDITEEAKYYLDHWGRVPDWTDPDLIREGGPLHEILHHEGTYGEQNRRWGNFNRNMLARFKTGKMGREEMARFLVEGDAALGLKAKRDLVSERRYVIERYGDIVFDREKGQLTAFPWLMNPDEYRAYMKARMGKSIAPDLVQSGEELDVLLTHIDKHMDTWFDEKVLKGREVGYDEFFTLTAKIAYDVMNDPVWLKRGRDRLGTVLKAKAEAERALVFTNIGFMTTNMIDAGVKTAWARYRSRAFFTEAVSDVAKSYGDRADWGWTQATSLLSSEEVIGRARIRESKSLWGKAVGISQLPLEGSGAAEHFAQLRLAQGMYDKVVAYMIEQGLAPELADVAARDFIGKRVAELWPGAGDGPIERLFNTFSPFMSYQFKNHKLYISELMGHPAFYNYFNHIGDYIEKQNRERWAREHPKEVMPDDLARLIELPWAPGVFIDFGQYSDIQRGIKPLYDLADGKVVVGQFASNFVRLVGASTQNIAYGIFNAVGYTPHIEYVQGRDKDGFPNGVWTPVQVPWEAPWGGTANAFNSFWPVETGAGLIKVNESSDIMHGKLNLQEATKLFFQTMFFGGLKQYDKGAGYNSYYFALRTADPDAAKEWLNTTPEGFALRQWWTSKAGDSDRFYTPQEVKDILHPPRLDPNGWFHSQSDEFQAKVKNSLTDLHLMSQKWDAIIGGLVPGTAEYKAAVNQSSTERWNYYNTHPWMYDYEAMSKSPEEWAKTLDTWQLHDQVNHFFNIEIPKQKPGETAVHWQKRVALAKRQRDEFLKAFPQVAQYLGDTRNAMEAVWKQTEDGWFTVLDQIGTRSIAIEAARQAKDYGLTDQLYLANELGFDKLNEDVAVDYFNPAADYNTLPSTKGLGPSDIARLNLNPTVKSGPFGQRLLARVGVLPDFNEWRYNRATPAGRAKMERDRKYAVGMAGVIAKAKASGNFGATFVAELKKHPHLMAEYFRRNPGKRDAWATTDSYIRQISKYGLLAKAGKFTEAGRYFDNLPQWVKDRYYNAHPEKRGQRANAQQNLQYMNFMERWTNYYKHRDYAGGAAFFDKLPTWVKDRYYAKHPQGFGKGSKGTTPYSKAMGKWVHLLQSGDKEGAKKWFDSMPAAFRKRYYEGHPEAKLRDNIKRTGQLGEYFGMDDAGRTQYLADNPSFAKWLKAQGSKDSTRRMLVMAGYQALPDDPFLRRVYREKYPEVFSAEAKGQQSLNKTYTTLAEHPEMQPAFKRWLEAVLASYAEELKHVKAPPRPLQVIHQRQHGLSVNRPTQGRSAAWVRLHSVG